MGGDEGSTGIVEDGAHRCVEGLVEDDSGEVRMCGGELEGEVRAEGFSHDNDRVWGHVAGLGEVGEGKVGVLEPVGFTGVGGLTLAVAPVVECEDVEADCVKGREVVDCVGEVAILAVEVEDGEAGAGRVGSGWDPPSGKLGDARVVWCEEDGLEMEVCRGRSANDGGGGVVKELPTALREKKAEDAPGADRCGEDGDEGGG